MTARAPTGRGGQGEEHEHHGDQRDRARGIGHGYPAPGLIGEVQGTNPARPQGEENQREHPRRTDRPLDPADPAPVHPTPSNETHDLLKAARRACPAAEGPPNDGCCDELDEEHHKASRHDPRGNTLERKHGGQVIEGDGKEAERRDHRGPPDNLTRFHHSLLAGLISQQRMALAGGCPP
jgi:hypothetical protein